MLLTLTLQPLTEGDRERLAVGLANLQATDSTLGVTSDDADSRGEVVLAGMSEHQLECVVDLLMRKFGVEARVSPLQVAYKETVTRPADGEMKYARQTGGRGQYGHVKLHLYPGEPGSGCVFGNAISNGAIPAPFINSIGEGITHAQTFGVLAGYPIDDVRVELYDGSYHDVDSSETAFKIAGSMAFQAAAKKAKPVLLEPVMRVEVVIPDECAGDVRRNLTTRRGQVQSMQGEDEQTIRALVPLAEMLGYATDLHDRTHGRGTFMMELDRYRPVLPTDDEGDRDSYVGAPRRPSSPLKTMRAAAPEPHADASD